MAQAPKKPKGRPPVSPDARRSKNFTFRSRAALHQKLDAAATTAGRSISEEIEYRLGRSFLEQETLIEALELLYGRKLAGLLIIMGDSMLAAGQEAGFVQTKTLDGAKNWFHDATAFAEAAKAANIVLDELGPSGDVKVLEGAAPLQIIGDTIPPEALDAMRGANIARMATNSVFEEAATGHTRSNGNVDRSRRVHRAGTPFPQLAKFTSPEFRDAKSHIGDDQ